MPSLTEALAHGHSLEPVEPRARSGENFCVDCGAWYARVAAGVAEFVEEQRASDRACCCCGVTKEKSAAAILVTITPQFYANHAGERLQKMGKGITVCMACLGAGVRGSSIKLMTIGGALKESMSGGYNAINDTFKLGARV